MAKDMWHMRASKSWWNGTVTSLCGITTDNYDTRWSLFSSPTCPDCKAIQKAQKKAGA